MSLDTKTIDKLLSYTEFDQKYWQEGVKLYDKIDSDYLDDSIYFSPYSELEFRAYLQTKDPNNSWVQYFNSLYGDQRREDDYDCLVRSIKLGNPYAMYLFTEECKDDEDPDLEKYTLLKRAADLGYPKAISKIITSWIYDYRASLMKDTGILEKIKLYLPRLEKIDSYDSTGKNPKGLANLYNNLYMTFEDEIYYRKYLQTLLELENDYLQKEYSWMLPSLIKHHFKLQDKYEELRKSYEELKKVKEMDFNDIVSNGVGDFLN